jgi:hypothetical protein
MPQRVFAVIILLQPQPYPAFRKDILSVLRTQRNESSLGFQPVRTQLCKCGQNGIT